MSFTNDFKSCSGTQPNFSFALVGSPINKSTSVGLKYVGSIDNTSFPISS